VRAAAGVPLKVGLGGVLFPRPGHKVRWSLPGSALQQKTPAVLLLPLFEGALEGVAHWRGLKKVNSLHCFMAAAGSRP
jgi:hypothetical protein